MEVSGCWQQTVQTSSSRPGMDVSEADLLCDMPVVWIASQVTQPRGRFAHFELVSCKCVDTYVRVKKNQNQICWKLRKVRAVHDHLYRWQVRPSLVLLQTTALILLLVRGRSDKKTLPEGMLPQ